MTRCVSITEQSNGVWNITIQDAAVSRRPPVSLGESDRA
jgi:hypothetical protein